ncbi:hypothetical protein DFH09DRAFT_1111232 [Mycena vulgaris]|nr:hypothetical protein DFH09DRAFT_1111232 [Mycena vulgaris]
MSALSRIAERDRIRRDNSARPTEDRENQLTDSGQTPGRAMSGRQPLGQINGTLGGSPWSFGQPGPLTPCPSQDSILGRRPRSPDPPASDVDEGWSRHTKVMLREFSSDTAAEYGVPGDKREDFIEASMLTTHKLLIVTLAAVLGGQEESIEDKMKSFLLSSAFKEHVLSRIRSVLLDPKLSSYKDGFQERLLRHIRLNPGTYHIPLALRGSITGRAFSTAVGAEATSARSEIKRKLLDGHNKKSDIVALGKSLAWNNTQEMTDEFWGRMAWLRFFLLDFRTKNNNHRGFWDAVDADLAERREQALEFPVEERAQLSSFIFEESLLAHTKEIPLKKGGKLRPGKQIPDWQKTIARAIQEMEQYTLEELAGDDEQDLGDSTPEDDADLSSTLDPQLEQ